MAINGFTLTNTYFVLNRKDRLGNIQSRPFQIALEEMKRQENEETKVKQSTTVKNEDVQNRLPSVQEENGSVQLFPKQNSNAIPTKSVEIPIVGKMDNSNNTALHFIRNSLLKNKINNDQSTKPSEVGSEPSDPMKPLHGQSRSRTCELL